MAHLSNKSFIQQFRLSVAMATNQNEAFVHFMVQEYSKHELKKFCQNTCNEIAIKANFHFSHYKPGNFRLP